MNRTFWLGVMAAMVLAGCRPEADSGPDAPPALPPPDVIETDMVETGVAPGVPDLADVSEHSPSYIGITYPQEARDYPGLARALQAYTDAALNALDEAVAAAEAGGPAGPFDLFIEYTLRARTPALVVVAADGGSYLGGARSGPLVERFVWLVEEERLLPVDALIAEPTGWTAVSNHLREVLYTAVVERVDAEGLPPEEREQSILAQGRLIDAGTTADPENFHLYEPLFDAAGRIHAIRFVFPPGQVAAEEEGTVTADVPAGIVLPHVPEGYRALFGQGA